MEENCKAIIAQGAKKGDRCWRPALGNKYCGKHASVAKLEEEKALGYVKCSNHRCLTTIEKGKKYCDLHIEEKKKENSLKTFCKAIIEQHTHKGERCKQEAIKDGYCGKHERQIIVDKAKNPLCEDGKRGCFNEVKEDCKKCEKCLEILRINDNNRYCETISDPEKCRICNKKTDTFARGTNGQALMSCIPCYAKEVTVEAKRPARTRDFPAEKKRNLDSTFDRLKVGAFQRGLTVNINLAQFTEIVNKKCSYCGDYNEETVRGVDRIDSSKGYALENCAACCGTCNIMKSDHSLSDFKKHILKIASYMSMNPITVINMEHIPDCNRKENKAIINIEYDNIKQIIRLYEDKELNKVIEWSILQKKQARFVSRLQELLDYKLSTAEFVEAYKRAHELNLREISVQKKGKKRMQLDEKILLFDQGRSSEYIDWIIQTFGETIGLVDKVNALVKKWKTYNKEEKEEEFAILNRWINNTRTALKKEENSL